MIGGGNSAGQAAVSLSQKARSVRVIVRGAALKTTMSSYLVERIERSPRIEVLTETEVVEIKGSAVVESVTLEGPDGSRHDIDTSAVYVMIGADPCTEVSRRDAGGRRRRLPALRRRRAPVRRPHRLAAVLARAGAAGDGAPGRLRRRATCGSGASNRVAGAVGDGALVVRFAHQLLSDDTPANVAAPS